MTPEEKHADAVEAAREWRDEEREQSERGNSLLQELVVQGVLEEVAPGRYWASKLRPDRDELS